MPASAICDDPREAARHRLAGPADLAALQQRRIDDLSRDRARPSPAAGPAPSHRPFRAAPRCPPTSRRPATRRSGWSTFSALSAASSAFSSATCSGGDRRVQDRLAGAARQDQRVAADPVGRRDERCRSRSWCWRRRRPGRSSPPSRTGRTCGRGSGRRPPSWPSRPRVTASICSSTRSAANWTWFAFVEVLRPDRQEPGGDQQPGPLGVAVVRAADRRRSAPPGSGRTACRRSPRR